MRSKFLADTHILIWALNQPHKLSQGLAAVLERPGGTLYYSPVSLWEIAIKYGLGKLDLLGHTPEEFFAELESSFFVCAPLSNEVLASSYRLTRHHGDPFDRLLFWQAISEGLTLLSADTRSDAYLSEGLQVIH